MSPSPAWAESVRIGPLPLAAEFTLPPHCRGLVVFAQATGAARQSARNRAVARALLGRRFGTLVLDLLAHDEPSTRGCAFDIGRLGERLADVLRWIDARPDLAALPSGVFGTGTGVAAALQLAAAHPGRVSAIVSRMGRPDLAGDALGRVTAPTLLLVGTESDHALAQNRAAHRRLGGEACVRVIAGPGDDGGSDLRIASATSLTLRWFDAYMPPAGPQPEAGAPGAAGTRRQVARHAVFAEASLPVG